MEYHSSWATFGITPYEMCYRKITYLDVPGQKLGSMVRINGSFHLVTFMGYIGANNPLILIILDVRKSSCGWKK